MEFQQPANRLPRSTKPAKSQREIAHLLGLSEGYVSKLIDRAWAAVKAAGLAETLSGTGPFTDRKSVV